MNLRHVAAALATAAAFAAVPSAGQVAKDALLVPPPDAQKSMIVSAGGTHGTSWRWRAADGSDVMRESILLRGMVWEQDEVVHFGPDGQPNRIVVRGTTPQGDAAETFTFADGKATWKSQLDSGSMNTDGRSLYWTAGGVWIGIAPYAELIYKAPGRRVTLLPGGEARMSKLVDIPVGSGASAKTVTSWVIEGASLQPMTVLMDGDRFFGWAGGMASLPEAYVAERAAIQKAQSDALAARNPAIQQRFGKVAATPVAFTNVRVFDAGRGRFLEGRTVVVNDGRIAAVGPAAAVRVPVGARVIDGQGKTLTPGLWDSHMHTGSDLQGVMLLSMGMTSARDPGASIAPTQQRNARIARGELLYPTVYSSLLIDGKGPLAAQIGVAVGSADEAIAEVRKAKAAGFRGVKFYGSIKPEWLKPAIVEARKLGLHVHGHVPATMRPHEAIAAGYQEITHINFVLMQAMPDAVVNESNGTARWEGPGRYGKDVDLGKAPMAALVRQMAAKRIAVDPTLVVFEGKFTAENGDLSPALAPFAGTMPPQDERGFRSGGDALPAGVTRADYRASFAKMVELTRRLHAAGVRIVAGTDGSGLELVRELELYVRAGLSPAQALQTATINPARLVGADKETGSIAVGKKADLVLVDGDASKDIGAMRRTLWVMQGGALMNADELREVAGFAGRPK